MSDKVVDNDDLSPTQEYAIAGIVILLFGFLYWFLNNNPDSQVIIVDKQALTQQTPSTHYAAIEKPTPPPITPKASSKPVTQNRQAAIEGSAEATPRIIDRTTIQTLPKTEPEVPTAEEKQSLEPTATQQESLKTRVEEDVTNVEDKQTTDNSQQPAHLLPNGNEVEIAKDGFTATLKQAIQMNQLNQAITFDNVYFHTGSARIRGNSEQQIKVTAALLHKHQNIKILLRGHTDNTGTYKQNALLSLDRANAMGVALVSLGISKKRIQIQGKGDTDPIASNESEEGRKQNRRLELLITQGTSE